MASKRVRPLTKAHKLACPRPGCGSQQILYAKRTKMYWCRVCGHEFTKPKEC